MRRRSTAFNLVNFTYFLSEVFDKSYLHRFAKAFDKSDYDEKLLYKIYHSVCAMI